MKWRQSWTKNRGCCPEDIMMKLSGALLLVLGCAGFGWCTCRDMERHIGQLHLLSELFHAGE
ncbi:MAG: hypothetical protein ACLUOI_06480 [Eisenbergiella sp.]